MSVLRESIAAQDRHARRVVTLDDLASRNRGGLGLESAGVKFVEHHGLSVKLIFLVGPGLNC